MALRPESVAHVLEVARAFRGMLEICKGAKCPRRLIMQQYKVAALMEKGSASLVAPPEKVGDEYEHLLGPEDVAYAIEVARAYHVKSKGKGTATI
jgi:hypothetical protein